MKRLAFALLLVSACSGAPKLEDQACPPGGTTLTYANFGKAFVDGYCVRCHGGPNGYSSRALNTVESIRASAARVYTNATGDNPPMPPGPDDPTPEERAKLAEWLACGAP
ncbi:MAG: c-type cytochrome [Myxococcales bacterium]|nr:c-type cytochrome [Myxococcales bacterium]